jgi:hypothetical protein
MKPKKEFNDLKKISVICLHTADDVDVVYSCS